MRLSLAVIGIAGFLLALTLVGYYGFRAVGNTLLTAGWGLFGVILFHFVPLTCSSVAWRALVGGIWPGPMAAFLQARWIREGVNDLLPVAQIGGQVAGVRVLSLYGAQPGIAGASVIVDMTIRLVTQVLFTLLGLAILIQAGYREDTLGLVLGGMALALPAVLGFIVAQRWGLFKLLERLLVTLAKKRAWMSLQRVEGLHDTILVLYRNRRRLLTSGGLHFLSWIAGAGETWLALAFMGYSLSLREALLLEGLGQAVRSAAFFVPGALGVQEVGFLLLGGMVGLGPEAALGLSLIKRLRDWVLGLPALMTWWCLEGRNLWSTDFSKRGLMTGFPLCWRGLSKRS